MMLSLKRKKTLNGIWSLSDDRNSTFRRDFLFRFPEKWELQWRTIKYFQFVLGNAIGYIHC
jgi:hypothetical protein